MELRPYQNEALTALFDYWHRGGGNPLLAKATGTGKSVVIAFLIKQLLSDYPGMRVLVTAPNRELIDQDVRELRKVWPDAPIGINCEGLGSRDTDTQILFATVNSIYRNPEAIGSRELIIIDEAHLIPHRDQGMYRATIAALRDLVPDLRVVGLTATPYRLDGGHLCEGEGHLFDSVVYEYSIAQGIRDGFLSPLSSKATKTLIDVGDVGKRSGEFITEQLEAVASELNVVNGACDEIVKHAGARRSWLAFCVGVTHAELVRDALRARGIDAEMVLGETPDDKRDRIIEEFRAGRLTCIVSVMVLSYGFNVPFVDLVALLRPTCSTGLYVQQVGRGTRKADGKTDALVLDFAGNVRRFGPVDDPRIHSKAGNGEGEAPTKTCPGCDEIVALAATECPGCGYEFPAKAKIKHAAQADNAEILSNGRTPTTTTSDWLEVEDVEFRKHIKETPSLRVSYQCGINTFSEWIRLEHRGFARTKAEVWWRALVGGHAGTGIPHTVNEALDRQDELSWPTHIRVAPDGKYWRIVGRRIDGIDYDVNLRRDWRSQPKPVIDDKIMY